jgi:hypothetical protein
LSPAELKTICDKLNLKKNSNKGLLEELKFLVKLYCAGQGPCHSYVQQRGRTGGWTDMWCQHDMKVASKMETMQAWLNIYISIAPNLLVTPGLVP